MDFSRQRSSRCLASRCPYRRNAPLQAAPPDWADVCSSCAQLSKLAFAASTPSSLSLLLLCSAALLLCVLSSSLPERYATPSCRHGVAMLCFFHACSWNWSCQMKSTSNQARAVWRSRPNCSQHSQSSLHLDSTSSISLCPCICHAPYLFLLPRSGSVANYPTFLCLNLSSIICLPTGALYPIPNKCEKYGLHVFLLS